MKILKAVTWTLFLATILIALVYSSFGPSTQRACFGDQLWRKDPGSQ